MNADAWRVARVARQFSETGIYEVSRFPGYPVQEIACSWIWRGGPLALNGASATASVIAVLVFVACARRLGCRDATLAGLALAMTPIFFVNSVTSKDYIWAIAFVLAGLFFVLHRRPAVAGLLLGLAVGCRITSAAMILPLGLILFGETEGSQRRRAIAGFALTSIATAVAVFAPVWIRYGLDFFTFYENHARPQWGTIAVRASSEVWGNIGLLGLVVVVVGIIVRRMVTMKSPTALPPARNQLLLPALGLTILTYLAAFLRLPDEAAYLIPVIPATLLLAARFAPRICFQICCVCLTIAPFLELKSASLREGAILADCKTRRATLQNIDRCLSFAETLPGENLIVVGGWEPQIAVLAGNRPALKNHYVYLLGADEISAARRSGRRIFYLPAIRFFNARVNGIDLADYGFDLFALYQARMGATRTR